MWLKISGFEMPDGYVLFSIHRVSRDTSPFRLIKPHYATIAYVRILDVAFKAPNSANMTFKLKYMRYSSYSTVNF